MRARISTGLAAAMLLAGCASRIGAQREPTAGATTLPTRGSSMEMMAGRCPVQVPGTIVTSTDVEAGVALSFTTTAKGEVAELRQRVRDMAALHNSRYAGGGRMMGGRGRGGMMAAGGMMMPAATASAVDIERGSRFVLRPTDPRQLDALRQHAGMQARRMASGECPMISPIAEGQQAPPPNTGHPDVEQDVPSWPGHGLEVARNYASDGSMRRVEVR